MHIIVPGKFLGFMEVMLDLALWAILVVLAACNVISDILAFMLVNYTWDVSA